jgi:HK97 family phage major capsid protein
MRNSEQIGERLHALRAEQAAFFEAHRTPDGALDMPAEKVAEARRRNDDITKLAKSYEDAVELEEMESGNAAAQAELERPRAPQLALDDIEQPAWSELARRGAKTIGERFTQSEQFAQSHGLAAGAVGPTMVIDLERDYGKGVAARGVSATLFDTASSYAPQAVRLPTVITPGEQQPTVASLLPQGRTTQNAIAYMEETTTTTGAAETAESGSKPEAALAFTERTSAVRKIAVSLPITDEALDDIPFIESYIDTRLRQFVSYREDSQLLVGNGTAPNLRGILNVSGVQTQAKGADPVPDAVFKAMTLIRTNAFLQPTGAVFHPLDWQDVRLLRTADGIYIWGNPSEAGPERIWGLDVVQTTAITQNTGLVGAFRDGAQIFRRSDLALQVGWINDQFVKNQRTIVVEERLALVVFRPKAFCTVTGI